MSNFRVIALKSLAYAALLGGLVAIGLYVLSEWFFEAKNRQTLINATELGNLSGGDVVIPIGSSVPQIQFKIWGSNQEYSLKEDPAAVRIVNFWASWCEPCVEEFPSFARLVRELDGKVSFVGVNEDKTLAEGQEFLSAFAQDFKGLSQVYFGYDQEKTFSKRYGILALPETFLVNRQGELVRRVSGFEKWDSPEAIKYFKELVQKYER